MSFLTCLLCLAFVFPSSLATHPFDRLGEQKLYPATTYDNSIPFNVGDFMPRSSLSHTVVEPPAGLHHRVHSNLQPVPHYVRPESWDEVSVDNPISEHWATYYCSPRAKPIPDCEAAINIIPAGHIIIDPSSENSLGSKEAANSTRFNAYVPRPLRKFFLPAAFRAGGCVVFVKYMTKPQWDPTSFFSRFPVPTVEPPSGFNAAAFMYHTVWPNSRRLAEVIQKKCGGRGGWVETTSSPESNKEFKKFRYQVAVGWAKPGNSLPDAFSEYNIYD